MTLHKIFYKKRSISSLSRNLSLTSFFMAMKYTDRTILLKDLKV